MAITDSPRIRARLVDMALMESTEERSEAAISPREREVLDLLGEHLTNAEIGDRLYISVRTVESHAASLRRKLGLADRQELVRYAAGRLARPSKSSESPSQSPLPTALTSFVGREAEREELADALTQSRLVTVVGAGGVGKTRLAIAVAREFVARFDRDVFYLDLVPVTDPAMVLPAFLASLGLSQSSGGRLESALQTLVTDREALLVFDNAEHVVNEVAVLVERVLSSSPRLTALITSRIRLTVPFERVYEIPGLSLADSENADMGDAVQLFVERAAAAGHTVVEKDDLIRISAICEALGGSALAIELAAARVATLGLDGLEAGLGDLMGVLRGGPRADSRHRSLQDTLEWSYLLLDSDDQAVMRRITTFASGFSVSAAKGVAGFGEVDPDIVPDSLASLVNNSLLTTLHGSVDRGHVYRAHETVRQYGHTKIHESDDHEVFERHLQWCTTLALALDEDVRSDDDSWRDRFDAVVDDLRAALEWAASTPEQRDRAHRVATTMGSLLFHRGLIEESQRRYEQAAELAADPGTASTSYRHAAGVATCRVEGEDVMRLLEDAAEAAERAGDPISAAVLRARAAEQINRWSGMFSEPPSQAAAEALLSKAREHIQDDIRVEAAVLVATAHTTSTMEPPDPLIIERALQSARSLKDPLLEDSALDAFTVHYILQGDTAAAAAASSQRLERLAPLTLEIDAAVAIKDALHAAVYINVAAGRLDAARHAGLQEAELPFLREEAYLSKEELMAPDALTGRWHEALRTSQSVKTSWERAGKPIAPGGGIGIAAVAMVHGLRGDHQARLQWMQILSEFRGVELENLNAGPSGTFGAIVGLHYGDYEQTFGLLSAHPKEQHWTTPLFSQWRAGLLCEAAVLSDAPNVEELLTSAETSTAGNPIAALLSTRSAALRMADHSSLPAIAAAFSDADYGYQAARTLIFMGGKQRRKGQAILDDLGAAPMAEP